MSKNRNLRPKSSRRVTRVKRDRVFVAHQERLWQHITLTDKTLRWTPKLGEVPEGLIFTIHDQLVQWP